MQGRNSNSSRPPHTGKNHDQFVEFLAMEFAMTVKPAPLLFICSVMCVPLIMPPSARAQFGNFWNSVDTVTAGDYDDLNPSITHNAWSIYTGSVQWLVFERHTTTESQIAAKKFDMSAATWDSGIEVIASRPAGEEQKNPDYSETGYVDTAGVFHVMRLAAWEVRTGNRWQILYSTHNDSAPAWSAPSLLWPDSLDNTSVQVRPVLSLGLLIAWKRANTVMGLIQSASAGTPPETLAVSSSDSLEYDIATGSGIATVIWTSDVQGKMTPIRRNIFHYSPVQSAAPETLLVPMPCAAPRLSSNQFMEPSFFFESQISGRWDVYYYIRYMTPHYGSLSGDSSSENHNAHSLSFPVITKPARSAHTSAPRILGLLVYEKYHGNDSSLVFINGFYMDTVRSAGHNWNSLVGSQVFFNQGGRKFLVVWESNRSGRSHIYSRMVYVSPDAIVDIPRTPSAFTLYQNYPNPFNPSTTIRYALPARSHVTLTVFNVLGQQVATLVDGTQDAGDHDVKYDGTGLASGVYFYTMRAGDIVRTKQLLILR
jgi:hypothetical protein